MSLNDEHAKLQKEYARIKKQLDELVPAHEKLHLDHQKEIAAHARTKAQLAATQPAALSDEFKQILRVIEQNEYVKTDGIARLAGIDKAKVEWIAGRLAETEHILITDTLPRSHRILQKGRDAIHNPSA